MGEYFNFVLKIVFAVPAGFQAKSNPVAYLVEMDLIVVSTLHQSVAEPKIIISLFCLLFNENSFRSLRKVFGEFGK